MAVFSKFLSLITGSARTVDLSTNTLSLGGMQLNGSTSGNLTQLASATTTNYSLTWPDAQGGALTFLQNDGSGNLSWAAAAAGGVTSVALADGSATPIFSISGSPVTSTGTLTQTLVDQPANLVFAGPVSGADAQPTFRALDPTDIPALAYANETLSNLSSPTAINQDLLPDANLTRTMGSNTDVWSALWIKELLYPSQIDFRLDTGLLFNSSGAHVVDFTNQLLNDSTSTTSIDWQNRILVDSAGTTQATWSTAGIELNTLTASTVPVLNASKVLISSAVTATELGYLSGVTSAIQTQLDGKLSLTGGTMSGSIAMGTNSITGMADPVSAQDAATKNYVDNLVAGLSWKEEVRAASVANVDVSSAPAAIDGVTLAANDRVLLKDQTAPAENGIYVFAAAASPLTRSTDMDTWPEVVGSIMLVTEGTINTGSKWVNSNVAGGTLGTTAITFVAFSVNGTVNGTGTAGQVAIWSGTATLTSEAFLATVRGGTGTDSSAATGIAHVASGVWTYSQIVNADVATGAAIAYAKLNLTASILLSDLASDSVDESKIVSTTFSASGAITGGSGTKVAVAVDNSSIEISSNALRIKTTAYDQSTIVGGGGTAASVTSAPAVKVPMVAGQTFTANTSYAVRLGITADSETAGRIYAADQSTSPSDLFYAIGMVMSTTTVTAGNPILMTVSGDFSFGSADTPFGTGTEGAPAFLNFTGVVSETPPTAAGNAVVKMGTIKARSATPASNVLTISIQVVGVN